MSKYRVVVWGRIPVRHEAAAKAARARLPAWQRHTLYWAALARVDGPGAAEALLVPGEGAEIPLDLSTIPDWRILRRPTAEGEPT